MKNILLLTDFSRTSKNAIEFVLEFFKNEPCHFITMYVHKVSSYTSDNLMLAPSENLYNSLINEQKEALNILIEHYKKENNNDKHIFEAIIDFDNFIDAINQTIKIKNIELVVLGSNGKTGAQEIIFGSNTLNVIRRVKCTTFIIPENYNYSKNKKAVLPLDSKDSLHGVALTELNTFISSYNYNLNVLRIISHDEYSAFTFYDQSNLGSIKHDYFVIRDIPTHYATNSFIQIKDIGLSVIIAHKEKLFHRFLKGSSISKLNSTLHIPILVLHND